MESAVISGTEGDRADQSRERSPDRRNETAIADF
jgi:hypothetical protein